MAATPPSRSEVEGLLGDVHGEPVSDLEPLAGGHWSAAFAYRVGGRELVLRIGELREGFDMDRAAMAFAGPHLPVPDVLHIGEALGRSYAISVRHHGRFLEDVRPEEAAVAGPALDGLLGALRSHTAGPGAPVSWHAPADAATASSTWRRWLTDGLVDDPRHPVHGWRRALAEDPRLDRLFRACEERVAVLVEACPERRDLVHGDLLNRNVLIADDATRVTAVFSWKCSVRGDFLFDVAWCTFWGDWHPGIAAIDVWHRTLRPGSVPPDALVGASERHHCYELQIGASHLGWCAWTGDRQELAAVAARTASVLERGPLR